jgi:hypothetical protein
MRAAVSHVNLRWAKWSSSRAADWRERCGQIAEHERSGHADDPKPRLERSGKPAEHVELGRRRLRS